MNPVPVMKLVEVIRGHETSDEITDKVMPALEATSARSPVEANDYPGFVSNRVLMPMINEAVFNHGGRRDQGSDRHGHEARHGHPMGPLTLADLIGLDVCLDILEPLARGPRRRQVPPLPAAAPDGRRGPARPEDRTQLLRLLESERARPSARDGRRLRRLRETLLQHADGRPTRADAMTVPRSPPKRRGFELARRAGPPGRGEEVRRRRASAATKHDREERSATTCIARWASSGSGASRSRGVRRRRLRQLRAQPWCSRRSTARAPTGVTVSVHNSLDSARP